MLCVLLVVLIAAPNNRRRIFFFRFQEAECPTGSHPKISLDPLCLKDATVRLLSHLKGTMINFSVSRPGTMSKPMRASENKKQSPQNKHVYPSSNTCNTTFYLHHSQKKQYFCRFLLSALSVLGIGLKKEVQEERRDHFCSHPPHVGVKN